MAPVMWYCASKKFAEIAAFETQKRVSAKYTLAAINPPSELRTCPCFLFNGARTDGRPIVILGPAIHYADAQGIDKSDVSTSSLYAALAAGKDASVPDSSFTAWADVSLLSASSFRVSG